ncbi:MAG: hypothetical protein WCJ62_13060, partial [Flavobacterium sp.]
KLFLTFLFCAPLIGVNTGRERIMKFKNKIDSVLWSNIRKHNDKLYVDRSGFKQQWDMSVILKLVNNKTGDTLYSADPYKFILVPYFVKQKQLYDKKIFIALTCIHEEVNKAVDIQTNSQIIIKPLSKWTCEVNLLKNINSYKGYEISYIFRNELNQTFLVDIPRQGSNCLHFILEDEYLAQEKEKQLKSAEQIAQKKKEEQDKIEKERISKQIHYQYCIEKFGQTKGELIAQGKVVIGMTTEMCEVAWGKPIDISKTTTKYASLENWYYGWKYSLYFENGYLIRIEN